MNKPKPKSTYPTIFVYPKASASTRNISFSKAADRMEAKNKNTETNALEIIFDDLKDQSQPENLDFSMETRQTQVEITNAML